MSAFSGPQKNATVACDIEQSISVTGSPFADRPYRMLRPPLTESCLTTTSHDRPVMNRPGGPERRGWVTGHGGR